MGCGGGGGGSGHGGIEMEIQQLLEIKLYFSHTVVWGFVDWDSYHIPEPAMSQVNCLKHKLLCSDYKCWYRQGEEGRAAGQNQDSPRLPWNLLTSVADGIILLPH